jgi:hypothetical protein
MENVEIPELLFVLGEQTPCALSHQHQKNKSTLSCHFSEAAARFFFCLGEFDDVHWLYRYFDSGS